MAYPIETERKLRKVFSFFTEKLLKKYREKLKEGLKALTLSKKDKKEFLYELKEIAIESGNKMFSEWKTLTKEELKREDLTGSKKWIRENYLLFEKLEKIIPEKLLEEREKQVIKTFNTLNKSIDFRLEKLEAGKIGKTDLKKIISQVRKIPNRSAEIDRLVDDLEKGFVPSQDDVKKLRQWVSRRNELWARNQTGNLQAMNLKDLWADNQIDEYIWRAKKDGRTRESHLEKDGKIFKISDGGLLPGEDYGCRCWAEPVMKKSRRK